MLSYGKRYQIPKKYFSLRHSRHEFWRLPFSPPGGGGIVEKMYIAFEFLQLVLSSFVFLGVRGASSKTIKNRSQLWACKLRSFRMKINALTFTNNDFSLIPPRDPTFCLGLKHPCVYCEHGILCTVYCVLSV